MVMKYLFQVMLIKFEELIIYMCVGISSGGLTV